MKETDRMDDWQILILGLCAFFFLIMFLLVWLIRDQSKLQGMIDSLRDDRRLVREEMDSLRIRLKELEIAKRDDK